MNGVLTNQSTAIDQLATAMAKAQSEIIGAVKDSKNPFFKSDYADLASVWDACRQQLTKNGLCVMQTTEVIDGQPCLATTLAHSSGQWIKGYLPLNPLKNDPQAYGSAMTYMRRYALAAIVGIPQIDDDGEAAMHRVVKNHSHDSHHHKADHPSKPVLPNIPGVGHGPVMATLSQAKMVWAKLKNEMNFEDEECRNFIQKHTGKEQRADLTAADIEILLTAIKEQMKNMPN